MADRVVVDVGAQLAVSLFREADAWAAKGDSANAEAALRLARSQLVVSGMDSRAAAEAYAERQVALTAAQLAIREADIAAAAAAATARATAAAAKDALVVKLTAGTATSLEVQQALATLLGGGKA